MNKHPKIGKILYCTDLGKHTSPVFMYAMALAEQNNGSIAVLHVVSPMSDTAKAVFETYISEKDMLKIQEDGMEEVFKYMEKRIKAFLQAQFGKSFDEENFDGIYLVSGTPSEEILKVAEEDKFDMIVMGKSSQSIMGSRVMGAVTREVVRFSKIPVLVIPNR